MKVENIRLVNINTTAFSEEDFSLLTTLSNENIVEVINPLVNAERDGYEKYDNDTLVESLKKRFPLEYIEMVVDADKIII